MQTLQQHQLVGLRGDGVRQRGADPALGGPQPQADGEGSQCRERLFDHCVHVVGASGEGQPEALWERRSQETCGRWREEGGGGGTVISDEEVVGESKRSKHLFSFQRWGVNFAVFQIFHVFFPPSADRSLV